MAKKNESYEEMMEKLENIVSKMSENNIPLEESIKEYEEGIRLCRKMNKILKDAEGKITVLTEDGEKEFNQEK